MKKIKINLLIISIFLLLVNQLFAYDYLNDEKYYIKYDGTFGFNEFNVSEKLTMQFMKSFDFKENSQKLTLRGNIDLNDVGYISNNYSEKLLKLEIFADFEKTSNNIMFGFFDGVGSKDFFEKFFNFEYIEHNNYIYENKNNNYIIKNPFLSSDSGLSVAYTKKLLDDKILLAVSYSDNFIKPLNFTLNKTDGYDTSLYESSGKNGYFDGGMFFYNEFEYGLGYGVSAFLRKSVNNSDVYYSINNLFQYMGISYVLSLLNGSMNVDSYDRRFIMIENTIYYSLYKFKLYYKNSYAEYYNMSKEVINSFYIYYNINKNIDVYLGIDDLVSKNYFINVGDKNYNYNDVLFSINFSLRLKGIYGR